MSNALATVNQNVALAQVDEGLSREQVDLLKKTICYGASDGEFELFIGFCKRLQLDPFSKQVHFVPRRFQDPKTGAWVEKREPMVAIDGFRVIAERSGRYEGQTAPQWCGPDKKWVDVWLDEAPPAAARVGIYKAGFREPIYQPATYLSYVQETKDGNPTKTWKKMPDVMLSKCAEALALRKAFPNDLSGAYCPEEMSQAARVEDGDFIEAVASPRPQLSAAPPSALERDLVASIEVEKAKKEVKLDSDFEAMNKRLTAVWPGDENKERRKGWMADAMRYQGAPGRLYQAFTRLDPETKAHVFAELAKLEEAAADNVPEFVRQPGEDDE